jgi:Tfp pilus assembly protein PilV
MIECLVTVLFLSVVVTGISLNILIIAAITKLLFSE